MHTHFHTNQDEPKWSIIICECMCLLVFVSVCVCHAVIEELVPKPQDRMLSAESPACARRISTVVLAVVAGLSKSHDYFEESEFFLPVRIKKARS